MAQSAIKPDTWPTNREAVAGNMQRVQPRGHGNDRPPAAPGDPESERNGSAQAHRSKALKQT